jgi:CBS domain-containing protein
MSSPVATVKVTSVIRDAAEEMWTKKIGSLIVVNNDGKLAGVITERDIIYACAKDMLKNEVETIMSRNVVTAEPKDNVTSVVQKMRSHNIRHMPVVESDRRPVGIISLRDVIDVAIGLLGLLTPPELE